MTKKKTPPPLPKTPFVRWMIRRDMPEVQAIENESFPEPWGEGDFIRVLRERNSIGMVVESHGRVCGYMIYMLHKAKLDILNFAVAPEFRMCGVGRQMIERLVAKLSPQRRTRLTFDVSENNLAGQMFLKACGFRAVSIVKDRFWETTGDNTDAYHFQYQLRQRECAGV